MCTCLTRNLSQRGQRRENRERERKRERERREHFRFRGSGELIKLPFRSGTRRELNRKFFWPGGNHPTHTRWLKGLTAQDELHM